MIKGETFEDAWPLLEPALKWSDGAHTKETLYRELARGDAFLWRSAGAAIVWKVVDEPSGQRVAFIWLVGGDLNEALEIEARICDAAKKANCKKIRGHGREGWTKKAPGYSDLGRVYTKEL